MRSSPYNSGRDAIETGCDGLLEGAARNLYSHKSFRAAACSKKDGPFYCPSCYTDAVVRKCSERRDHFAHRARLSPDGGDGEGGLHKACKEEICALLAQRFPEGKWQCERPIPANAKKNIPELRPDVSGRVRDLPLAVEVQASSLTISEIIRRTSAYAARNIALLWLVPLTKPLGNAPFRPRLYERYLHSIYFGRTYYWWQGQGLSVFPVHYEPATRHVELREWFEDGALQTGGGYDALYKIVKKPCYGKNLDLERDFDATSRAEFTPENERKRVPRCHIWHDQLECWWQR